MKTVEIIDKALFTFTSFFDAFHPNSVIIFNVTNKVIVPLTHRYKIADGECSSEQLKCLKVSAQQSFRPNSPTDTKLLMVSTHQNYKNG